MIDDARKQVGACIRSLVVVALLWPLSAAAQETCKANGVVFGFFNGVQTTKEAANNALYYLGTVFPATTFAGQPITYELFYNDTQGFSDFVETFDQRLQEHNGLLAGRFELFFSAIKGGGGWWDALTSAIPALTDLLGAFVDSYKAAAIKALTGLASEANTAEVSDRHRKQIEHWGSLEKRMLFFAHSQGNLFVNEAHAEAVAKVGADSVRVVHVAPASPALSGRYVLADKDLVINGLRLVGSVPSNTDTIPPYLTRPAGLGGGRDILGHGLLEIYLNPRLSVARIHEDVQGALHDLDAAPRDALPLYPEYVEREWLGGDRPAMQRAPDEYSHTLEKQVNTSTQPNLWRWDGDAWVRKPYEGADLLKPRTTMSTYSGKGVSGAVHCVFDEDPGTYGAERFFYRECVYRDWPDIPDWGRWHGDQWPRELSSIAQPFVGDVVALQTETWHFDRGYPTLVNEVREGEVRFLSGAESRWVKGIQEEHWRSEPFWRKGGAVTNQAEIDAWQATSEAHWALVRKDLERYWVGWWEHERQRLMCQGS